MNEDQINAFGVIVKNGQRHISVGRILNANLPIPWVCLLTDAASPIKLLYNWVWETEWRIFNSSVTEEDYLVKVEETCEGAIEVDQEIKAQSTGQGMVHPAHASFPLSQLLTLLMQFCKRTEDLNISESILYFTCGIMDLPEPLASPNRLQEGDITQRRAYTCFRLLKWIFPDPFEDGVEYVKQDVLKFAFNCEKAIFRRCLSIQEYYASIEHLRRELTKYRTDENQLLSAMFPGALIPFDHGVFNANFMQPQQQVQGDDDEEEEEEEEEEEGDEEEEEEEEEDAREVWGTIGTK